MSVGQSKQRIAVGKPMATDGGCEGYARGSIVLKRFFFVSFLFIEWKRNENP